MTGYFGYLKIIGICISWFARSNASDVSLYEAVDLMRHLFEPLLVQARCQRDVYRNLGRMPSTAKSLRLWSRKLLHQHEGGGGTLRKWIQKELQPAEGVESAASTHGPDEIPYRASQALISASSMYA